MEADIIKIVITAFATGAISTLATVKALGVHISYLKEHIQRHEHTIQRAHERIDNLERGTSHG